MLHTTSKLPLRSRIAAIYATGRLTSAVLAIFAAQAFAGLSPVGINLAWLGRITANEWVFTDVMKHGTPWYVQDMVGGDFGRPDSSWSFRDDGYPAKMSGDQRLISMIYNSIDGHYPAGEYLFTWEGSGTVFPTWDAVITSQEPGRIVAQVTPSNNGIAVYLESTDSLDPVRNVKLILPGFHDTYEAQPFHPLFLERWAKFPVLRFMWWQNIQSSPVRTWNDRVTPSHYIQGSARGAALEHMILLSNLMDADPWFCMPHLADDDYVRQFAQMVRDSLDPERKIYLEYSNEVWNPSDEYAQTAYVREKGLELGLSDNPGIALARYKAQRSLEIFAIWEEVFGGTERVVRVLATQTGNWLPETSALLDHDSAYTKADLLAVGAYFTFDYDRFFDGSGYMDSLAALPVDDIITLTYDLIDTLDSQIALQRAEAEARGLGMTVYEGGQALIPFGEDNPTMAPFTEKMLAVNRDPRMADLYHRMFAGWDSLGGGLFLHFNSTEKPALWGWYGTFEHMEHSASEAPKYQAMLQYIDGIHTNAIFVGSDRRPAAAQALRGQAYPGATGRVLYYTPGMGPRLHSADGRSLLFAPLH